MKHTGLLSHTSTYKIHISEFYPGDLRSVQFRDLPIISLWGNMKMLTASNESIKTTQFFQDHDHSSHLCRSGCNWWSGVTGRSPQVKWRHNSFFANKPRQNGDRDVQMVPNELVHRTTSEDVHNDLLGSWSDLDLTWSQIFKLTLQGQKVHVSNQPDEANTMASFLFYYRPCQKSY